MNKYKSDSQFVFPVSSNQNMNRILKKIGSISGLDKPLSMHMARHTFATYAMTKNVSIETISQMLGHKSIKSTEIYAKVVDSKISDEMDMFNQTIPIISNYQSCLVIQTLFSVVPSLNKYNKTSPLNLVSGSSSCPSILTTLTSVLVSFG